MKHHELSIELYRKFNTDCGEKRQLMIRTRSTLSAKTGFYRLLIKSMGIWKFLSSSCIEYRSSSTKFCSIHISSLSSHCRDCRHRYNSWLFFSHLDVVSLGDGNKRVSALPHQVIILQLSVLWISYCELAILAPNEEYIECRLDGIWGKVREHKRFCLMWTGFPLPRWTLTTPE